MSNPELAPQPERGRIVVGVDGSPGSEQALHWALREAAVRGSAVHVVHGWRFELAAPPFTGSYGLGYWGASVGAPTYAASSSDNPAGGEADQEADANQWLASVIDKAIEDGMVDITRVGQITREAVEGHPAKVLLDTVARSDLLVVGSRGHGGFVGALLGSVSHQLVSHACCPVVVVPGPDRQAKDDEERPPR